MMDFCDDFICSPDIMDTNGTRYGSWRPPEASPISSTSVELAGKSLFDKSLDETFW